jgi:hypothetical protein
MTRSVRSRLNARNFGYELQIPNETSTGSCGWLCHDSLFFFFNACILRYYLSRPLTSLSCSLNAVFPGLKLWDAFTCAKANFLTHFIISIAVLENVPPGAGLQKRANFSTLNVGLPGTGNRTRDTCVA